MTLEVFQIPELLREQLIEFQTRQARHPLSELDNYREQLQGGIHAAIFGFAECSLPHGRSLIGEVGTTT